MDDFERRLSVALKTAVRDLPASAPATAEALRVDDGTPVHRPRRPRILLATAVLLVLAVVVAGSWWAVSDQRRATPAEPGTCGAGDVRATAEPTPEAPASPGGGSASLPLAIIDVTATTTCVLTDGPAVATGDRLIRWEGVGGLAWTPVDLGAGDTVRFAVSGAPTGSCQGRGPRSDFDFRLGGSSAPVLTFGVSTCALEFSLGTYGALPNYQPCTADTVGLTHDESPTLFPDVLTVLSVTARSECSLLAPPTLTLDGAPESWVPGDGPWWAGANLADGATIRFAVHGTSGQFGPGCPGVAGQVTATAGATPAATTAFDLGTVVCGPVEFTTYEEPVLTDVPGSTMACTAADLEATPWRPGVIASGPAGVVLHVRGACELDAPPTVTVAPAGGAAITVPFAGVQPQGETPWLPEVLRPGDTAEFSLLSAPSDRQCADSLPVDVTVEVAVGGTTVTSFSWSPLPGCGLDTLRLVTGLR